MPQVLNIFMVEIDSIGSTRTESGSGGGDSEVQRTMPELLNQTLTDLNRNQTSSRAIVYIYVYIYVVKTVFVF